MCPPGRPLLFEVGSTFPTLSIRGGGKSSGGAENVASGFVSSMRSASCLVTSRSCIRRLEASMLGTPAVLADAPESLDALPKALKFLTVPPDRPGAYGNEAGAAMDVLSDVIRVVRLSGAVFFTAEFSSPWALESPNPSLHCGHRDARRRVRRPVSHPHGRRVHRRVPRLPTGADGRERRGRVPSWRAAHDAERRERAGHCGWIPCFPGARRMRCRR